MAGQIAAARELLRLTRDRVSGNAQEQRQGAGHGQHPIVLQTAERLAELAAGVARDYTPKAYEIQDIMSDLVDIAVGYERAARMPSTM